MSKTALLEAATTAESERDSRRTTLHREILLTLEEMPALMRRIFTWAHYRNLPLSAIADRTGLSTDKITDLLTEARLRLRRRLHRFLRSDGNEAAVLRFSRGRKGALDR